MSTLRINLNNIELMRTAELRVLYTAFLWANPETPKNVKIFATDENNGYAYARARIVTVPTFVWEAVKGKWPVPQHSTHLRISPKEGYIEYYLAHELAHIKTFDMGVLKEPNANHGPVFMECFKLLCPEEYQHWEYEYKPLPALKANVAKRLNLNSEERTA